MQTEKKKTEKTVTEEKETDKKETDNKETEKKETKKMQTEKKTRNDPGRANGYFTSPKLLSNFAASLHCQFQSLQLHYTVSFSLIDVK